MTRATLVLKAVDAIIIMQETFPTTDRIFTNNSNYLKDPASEALIHTILTTFSTYAKCEINLL